MVNISPSVNKDQNKMVTVYQNQWALCRIRQLSLHYSVKGPLSYDTYEEL